MNSKEKPKALLSSHRGNKITITESRDDRSISQNLNHLKPTEEIDESIFVHECDEPVILGIFVVGFHHERGHEIEWRFPQESSFESSVLEDVAALAMPDQAHLSNRDYCYFRTGKYYATACFMQVPASKAKDQIEQITRSAVQKSVVVLSKKPLYGAIRYLLDPCTRAYFDQGYFNDRKVLIDAYTRIDAKFSKMSPDIRDALFLGVSFKNLIKRFGRNTLMLFKLLWLERKIIFYGVPINLVCESVMSLVALMPNLLPSLTFDSKKDYLSDEEAIEAERFSIPLTIFDNSYLAPHVALQHIDMLASCKSFFVGTSNKLFLTGVLPADILVTIEVLPDGMPKLVLDWKNKDLEKVVALTTKDRQFIDNIIMHVEQELLQEKSSTHGGYVGSDLWIRNMFAYYTKCVMSCQLDSEISAKSLSPFNEKWTNAWSNTNNYKIWKTNVNPIYVFENTQPLHPAHDMKTAVQQISSTVSQGAAKLNSRVTSYFMNVYYSNLSTHYGDLFDKELGENLENPSFKREKDSEDNLKIRRSVSSPHISEVPPELLHMVGRELPPPPELPTSKPTGEDRLSRSATKLERITGLTRSFTTNWKEKDVLNEKEKTVEQRVCISPRNRNFSKKNGSFQQPPSQSNL